MQQAQAQVPTPTTPQQRKRKRFSRNMIIGIACVVAIIIGGFWIAVSVGWLPSLLGISPTNLALIASVIVAILGGLFTFIQIVPNDKESEQAPTPAPQNIIIQVPPYQPVVPVPPSPISSLPPVPPPSPSLTYRGMAQPPSTNSKTIQQRADAVKEVYEKLTQPDISALVLVGIGGLGKSTLAALVYNYVEQQRKQGKGLFKRETLWLRVEENATFLTVAENTFNVLGNKPSGFEQLPPQSQAYVLLNTLNKLDPPLLIVLDQFENLLNRDTGEALTPETGELLDALNSRSCPSRILMTSRFHPEGIRMTTYDSLVLYPVSDLTVTEGQALLKSQGVTNATEDDLQTAVQRCSGHSYSLSLLASLLGKNKLSLSTLLNDPTHKQLWDKNVAEKLLAEIYTRLSDQQRELLHALSIYREAVPRDAIQALISDPTQAQLDTLLSTLQAQQLVQVVEGDCRQLHPIVATYAQNHDEQSNKEGMYLAHGKAAQYYMEQAAKKCPPRNKRQNVSDVQLLIEAVWQFCQAEQWQEAYELMRREQLFTDLKQWGGYVTLLELCQLLTVGKWVKTEWKIAFIYTNMAVAYDMLGQKNESIAYYKEAQQFFESLNSIDGKKGKGIVLNNLGKIYGDLGRWKEALEYYEQALEVRRKAKDRHGEGTTLNNIGHIYNELRQEKEAFKYYTQSLVIRQEVKDNTGEGTTLNNLGYTYAKLKEKKLSQEYYEKAMHTFSGLKDEVGKGASYNNLGKLYDDLGEKRKAREYYEKALSTFRKVGDIRGEGTTLNNLGGMYEDLNQSQEALEFYKQSLIARKLSVDKEGEGITLHNIGTIYLKEAQYEIGLACCLLARDILRKVQNSNKDIVQRWVDALRQKIGDKQFVDLLKNIEPYVQQIVDDALREVQ